jgi:hypothetical protein
MAFHLADADEANAVNRPHLRYFSVPNVPSADPVGEISSKWEVADPQVVRTYTAVGSSPNTFRMRSVFRSA